MGEEVGSERAESDRERSRRAWRRFCAELEGAGERLLGDGPHLDDRSIAEGYRYLSRLTRLGLELCLEYGDPAHPRFVNHERPSIQWGGPNPDNYYLRATIDPACSYRVWGDVDGVEDVIFALMEGDMALEQYGVYSETTLSQFVVENGRLEFVVSPDDAPGNRMAMHPAATNLTVRVYQSDPIAEPAPFFHIERIDPVSAAPPAIDGVRLEQGLADATRWITGSATYWQQYMERFAAGARRNELTPPSTPPGGADNILYGGGMWCLEEGEALVIECPAPDAAYWNFTIHTYPWFESGDHEERQTSLNHRTTHIDGDGIVRLVVSHDDPGVPNWIDTEGRRESLLTYRWIHANDAPHPSTRLSPLADVRTGFPDDHPMVTPPQRQAALALRSAGMRERYR